MAKGWHTTPRETRENPGKATEMAWKLPAGVAVRPVQWPRPEAYAASDMTTYVYHGDVLLLVPSRFATI